MNDLGPQSRIASLSLDLDDKWSYLKTRGDESWRSFPSYLDMVVPRILDFLENRRLRISFFIVGKDAARPRNRDLLLSLAFAGHEIANHSFKHDPWFHLYSDEEIEEDIVRAEEQIQSATGQRPVGFRGPGYSMSKRVLKILARRQYLYDATAFPNILNPLARYYFLATSGLKGEERQRRQALFGKARDAFRPNKPYEWDLGELSILEIPVTTMAFFKIPIHLSYIIFLSKYSRRLALNYFRFALEMCRWGGVQPSILLHPLDFIGVDDFPDMTFFPGMDIARQPKLQILDEVLSQLAGTFQVVPVKQHADAVKGTPIRLRRLDPSVIRN